MHVEIVVPQIGEAISELYIAAWHKEVGDIVHNGDVLFEVDSDKAIVEVESFVDGRLVEIRADAGSAVMPRDIVAIVETEQAAQAADEPADEPPVAEGAGSATRSLRVSPVAQRLAAELDVDLTAVVGSGPGGRVMADDIRRFADQTADTEIAPAAAERVLASPKAKRLAAELNVALQGIQGTGVRGLVTSADVQSGSQTAALPASPHPLVADTATPIPLTRLRHAVARNMLASKQQVPHFYLMVDVNMSQVNDLRAYCKSSLNWAKAPTYTDVLVRAAGQVLAAMPELNVSYSDDGLVYRTDVGIGVAVNTAAGLVVPVISGVHQLSLMDVSEAVRSAAERARQGRMKPADMGPKSLVISNLGMYGVDTFIAIIDMPDPMILAVGRVADRVVPVHGHIVVQPTCTLTLSVDHRALDGAQGAQFLDALKQRLENPFDVL